MVTGGGQKRRSTITDKEEARLKVGCFFLLFQCSCCFKVSFGLQRLSARSRDSTWTVAQPTIFGRTGPRQVEVLIFEANHNTHLAFIFLVEVPTPLGFFFINSTEPNSYHRLNFVFASSLFQRLTRGKMRFSSTLLALLSTVVVANGFAPIRPSAFARGGRYVGIRVDVPRKFPTYL
jgi:hypothetical protein